MLPSPTFNKPDRYKSSSYRAYNYKMPTRYDGSILARLCQLSLWHRTVVEALQGELESARILDIGCGTGSLLSELAKAGATSLSGVDIAPNILKVAERKLATLDSSADLRSGDAEDRLPWTDECFDMVTLTGVLHHFYRPHEALAEMNRVLRVGGQLILIDPCFHTPTRQIFNLYLRILPHDGDCRFYSAAGAHGLILAHGFTCKAPQRLGLWAYFLRATKAH